MPRWKKKKRRSVRYKIVCSDLIRELNRLAPPSLACDWDNPGLLVGRAQKEVEKVMTCLDVTDAVIDQAVNEGVDMIVSHHPLIFHAVKQVNDDDFIGRRILRLARHDIVSFAMHTNFDIAPGCMADLAADRLGMTKEEPLEITGEINGEPVGIGKVGFLPEPMTLADLAKQVEERFELPFVTVFGSGQTDEPVRRIAVSPGSGRDMTDAAVQKNVQVLITGDIGHHEGIDAAARKVAVIDAGHYGIEHIFIDFMKDFLISAFGGAVTAVTADPAFPQQIII